MMESELETVQQETLSILQGRRLQQRKWLEPVTSTTMKVTWQYHPCVKAAALLVHCSSSITSVTPTFNSQQTSCNVQTEFLQQLWPDTTSDDIDNVYISRQLSYHIISPRLTKAPLIYLMRQCSSLIERFSTSSVQFQWGAGLVQPRRPRQPVGP